MERILITGGCGFIGSALVRYLIKNTNHEVVNVDDLSKSPFPGRLNGIENHARHFFEKANVTQQLAMDRIFRKYCPTVVFHLAGLRESSLFGLNLRRSFMVNAYGTFVLLESARAYVEIHKPEHFKLLHVSVDDVYGEVLGNLKSQEYSPIRPSTPFGAFKSAADLMMRTWAMTYHTPIITVRLSNVYGPGQNIHAVIPRIITDAISSEPFEIKGEGDHVRDWIYIDDLVISLITIARSTQPGSTINVGSGNEATMIEIASTIVGILDDVVPRKNGHSELVRFVQDDPTHDKRRSMSLQKFMLATGIDVRNMTSLDVGLRKTVEYYLDCVLSEERGSKSVPA